MATETRQKVESDVKLRNFLRDSLKGVHQELLTEASRDAPNINGIKTSYKKLKDKFARISDLNNKLLHLEDYEECENIRDLFNEAEQIYEDMTHATSVETLKKLFESEEVLIETYMGAMELSKVTSKTSSIKALLLRAWRERWSDLQWGIHIKTILPRGVSGDVYNLADCILQQALVGAGPNHLVLSYLRHSLSSQLISYAALLQHISKYQNFHKPHCILSLLELLETSQVGTTCRGRTEEGILPTSMLSVVYWLLQCFQFYIKTNSPDPLYDEIQLKCVALLSTMLASNFTTTMLYLGKHEEKDLCNDVVKKCIEIQDMVSSSEGKYPLLLPCLEKLMKIELNMPNDVESVTYCLQPLLSVELTMNPCVETSYLVNKLIMLQRLKGYSNPRLYCEIMRACLISLNNVLGTSEESQWGAFTFLKLPHLFKQLHLNLKDDSVLSSECSQDIVDSFDLLLQLRPLLDIVDNKGYCDFVECLLAEFLKVNVVSSENAASINKKREAMSNSLLKSTDSSLSQQSIPKVIVRAEPTLPRLLRTLDTDNIKMESLLSVLGQVLTGKSFELILVVATVDGKLRTFVQKLIKFNEAYKHGPSGETSKQAQTRALLFDITFLMLCSIVNQYGSQCVLSEEGGDSFFEVWVRECMVEKGHPKPPESIINLADALKSDALLQQFNSNEEFKLTQVKWDQVCLSAPGVIKDVLLAWEQDVLASNDVLRILDAMRSNICCLSVCATAWLCSYMQILHQDALLKPMNMVQQFLAASPPDSSSQDNFKAERFAFMSQIIRRMQHNIHPAPTSKISLQHGIIANTPISTQLEMVWNKIHKQGWVNIEATHQLQSLFATGGPCWFITNVLKEVFKYRYQEELNRAVDLAFAVFHLDIENCTLSLLLQVLPQYLYNKLHCEDLVEPQLSALAKLCVYCIFSAAQVPNKETSKKRSRKQMEAEDGDVLYPASKLLKLPAGEIAVGFGSCVPNCKAPVMSPALQAACNHLFNAFLVISNREGEISEQTHFVYKILETMVQCGGEKTRLVLQGQPLDSLMPNLIRWLPDMLSLELVAGLYDVTSTAGRRAAARDLCMLTNLQASPFYK